MSTRLATTQPISSNAFVANQKNYLLMILFLSSRQTLKFGHLAVLF